MGGDNGRSATATTLLMARELSGLYGTNLALAPSYPAVRDSRWSPDGTYLLFISGEDLVVRTVN